MRTQYEYTHIIQYKYCDEVQQRVFYYCNDSYQLSHSELDIIRSELGIEDCDEFEVVGCFGNDFNSDEYLSDKVVWALNDQQFSDLFGLDFGKANCSYINQIFGTLSDEEKAEYRIKIASSILTHLKAKGINKELVKSILKAIGLTLQDKGGIMAQLRFIASPQCDDIVLKQLAIPSNISTLKHILKRMNDFFSFKTEPSQLKIATIFYVFMESTDLLRVDVKGKFDTVIRLLSDFYGIPKPTQRRADVLKYLETHYSSPKGLKKSSKLIFQEKEHIKFWNSLK